MAKEALKYIPEEEQKGLVEPGEERSEKIFSGEIDTKEYKSKKPASAKKALEYKEQRRRMYILETINKYRKEIKSKLRKGEEAKKKGDFTMSALGVIEKQREFDKFVESLNSKELEAFKYLIEEIRQL